MKIRSAVNAAMAPAALLGLASCAGSAESESNMSGMNHGGSFVPSVEYWGADTSRAA
ncbi:hypothetical protein [Microbacterium wangchenii]|uniref:hypothetical protein n=1 Tax=Microbacterium wangchenii TaxID=2541726 RepID=UPI0021C3208F|nr:hypothetical protein [Microbacterium wangchenii]